MRSLRVGIRLCVVASLLCAAACVESRNPLSDPSTCTPDEDLIGVWAAADRDGGQTFVMVGRQHTAHLLNSPKGIMCMASAGFDKDGHLSTQAQTNTFFVSTIGREKFMNHFPLTEASKQFTAPDNTVVTVWNPGGVKKYTLSKYEITKDKLVIWQGDPSQRALATLVDNGSLVGSVKWDDKRENPTVNLTDSTDGLARFLRGGGSAQMFPDTVRLPNTNEDSPCKVQYRRVRLVAK